MSSPTAINSKDMAPEVLSGVIFGSRYTSKSPIKPSYISRISKSWEL
jgi:hypothetical protein